MQIVENIPVQGSQPRTSGWFCADPQLMPSVGEWQQRAGNPAYAMRAVTSVLLHALENPHGPVVFRVEVEDHEKPTETRMVGGRWRVLWSADPFEPLQQWVWETFLCLRPLFGAGDLSNVVLFGTWLRTGKADWLAMEAEVTRAVEAEPQSSKGATPRQMNLFTAWLAATLCAAGQDRSLEKLSKAETFAILASGLLCKGGSQRQQLAILQGRLACRIEESLARTTSFANAKAPDAS